jgi:voltage-gated potassium channel
MRSTLMSYTATTIGFGEIPYPLSYPQRAWVIVCIFASVMGWAYFIGIMLALLQDRAFRLAVARQAFVRKVKALAPPVPHRRRVRPDGRMVAEKLDARGAVASSWTPTRHRWTPSPTRNSPATFPHWSLTRATPASLGLAGLGSPYCTGVLALTHDDEVNLAIVMAVSLLREDVPVIAWRERSAHRSAPCGTSAQRPSSTRMSASATISSCGCGTPTPTGW